MLLKVTDLLQLQAFAICVNWYKIVVYFSIISYFFFSYSLNTILSILPTYLINTFNISILIFTYNCRKGKIPDLSQADMSHYQVHKIQPIIEHHVLLLDFAITIYKPIEICQVSCKNQSRISAHVSDDLSSLTRVSDDSSRFARVSDDSSNPARVSDDTSEPIRL